MILNKENKIYFASNRFPNLAIGNITRDRVRKALQAGITADQVRVLQIANRHML